jgi:bacterioferritin
MADIDRREVIDLLNRILEQELAGVVRYTHYSFLVFGYNRIPIVSWLREQASESLLHAQQAGEMITLLGAYPSLAIGPLLDSHKHDVGDIMREALETEEVALSLYKSLLGAVEGRSVMLEEYARQMIYAEEIHAGEVDKMLRRPMVPGTASSNSGGYQTSRESPSMGPGFRRDDDKGDARGQRSRFSDADVTSLTAPAPPPPSPAR